MSRLFAGFGKTQPERPYLKLCTKCHGKGQLSYFTADQTKAYQACDKCTNGNPPTGLGVTLKCVCQDLSAPYEYLTTDELRYLKHVDEGDKKALIQLQQQLGNHATALLLTCDQCNKRYLCKDVGGRCKIRGDESINAADKELNKAVAQKLVDNGILYRLETVRSAGDAGGRNAARPAR